MVKMRFNLASDEAKEIEKWLKEHDKTCQSGDSRGVIQSSKYRIAFRQTSIIELVEVICDCGKEFQSTKRMDKA